MNQVTLSVRLSEDKETKDDVLSFMFADGEERINLNLDSNQSDIKNVFIKLIQESVESDILLDFSCESGYGRTLYKEVCEEYIKDLQKEIDEVRDSIRTELGLKA